MILNSGNTFLKREINLNNTVVKNYYNEAFGIAKRFNDRNGTNKFTDGFNMSFLNAL